MKKMLNYLDMKVGYVLISSFGLNKANYCSDE